MRRKYILSALSISVAAAALTLSLGNPALADGRDDGHYRTHAVQRDFWRDYWRDSGREQRRDQWREQRREHWRGDEEHRGDWWRRRDGEDVERDGAWYTGQHQPGGIFGLLSD